MERENTQLLKVSERISVIQILTGKSTIKRNATPQYRTLLNGMKMKITQQVPADHMITIINVYAPHTGRVRKNINELEHMYIQLADLINNFKNLSTSLNFIVGDFNAKI